MDACTPIQSRPFRLHSAVSAVIIYLLTMAAPATAQWPTSYLSPLVLSSGADVRAGNVLVMPDGGVVAPVDTNIAGVHQIKMPRFDAAGNSGWSGSGPTYGLLAQDSMAIKMKALPGNNSSTPVILYSQQAQKAVDALNYTYIFQQILQTGNFTLANYYSSRQFEAGIRSANSITYGVWYDPWDSKIGARALLTELTNPIDLAGAAASDFSIVEVGNATFLVPFIKKGHQPETPGEVWVFPIFGAVGSIGTPVRAQNQGAEFQSNPQLADLGVNRNMLTWIGTLNGTKRLYGKVVDDYGTEISATRLIMTNVVDYHVTTSTLGLPVFAGLLRNTAVHPPVDTVFAGLIDAQNGASLTIPFAEGVGAQVKDIRQEASGDFSLTYSVAEGGTNLLKVRRISGTSAATLWDTTVADLGNASNDIIERYPNAFVDGTPDGTLYVLSRRDSADNTISSLALARVRPNGQLGADPLLPPTDLHAAHVGLGNVQLTWTDNTNSESHYIVGRTLTDLSAVEILGSVPANNTTFVDTTAATDTTYFYYVAAYQAGTGNFAISEPVEFTTPDMVIVP